MSEETGCEGFFFDHHDWERWQIVEMKMIQTKTSQSFDVLRQQRVCKRCGLTQVRKIDE